MAAEILRPKHAGEIDLAGQASLGASFVLIASGRAAVKSRKIRLCAHGERLRPCGDHPVARGANLGIGNGI